MKRICSYKALLLVLGVAVLVMLGRPSDALAKSSGKYVVDMADILNSNEEAELEAKLSSLSDSLGFDIVVVSVSDLEGKTPMEYADDYFDYNGYGRGSDNSGCLFLRYINDSSREVWISTCGRGIPAISDAYIDDIFDAITDDFGDSRYASAFSTYADMINTAVAYYDEHGKTYVKRGPIFTFWGMVIPVFIGLIAATTYTNALKAELNSVKIATHANEYESNFELTNQSDRFIRSAVTKTLRESSSSGSGSSSHTSSSGSSHGGGGRSM